MHKRIDEVLIDYLNDPHADPVEFLQRIDFCEGECTHVFQSLWDTFEKGDLDFKNAGMVFHRILDQLELPGGGVLQDEQANQGFHFQILVANQKEI